MTEVILKLEFRFVKKPLALIVFYRLFLLIYLSAIRLVRFWNVKAALWIKGRRNFFSNLRENYPQNDRKKVWMHCASLGEFEQGRPVLRKIREAFPDVQLVITFFSASGYEIARRTPDFDQIYYLPMDSPSHARRLISIFKPDLILWVKYEYWFYYLSEIQKKGIPLLLISGIYQPRQPFFKWYGGFYRKMLGAFTHFFLQNDSSRIQLERLVDPRQITVSGDTRCDRVIQVAENFMEVEGISAFCGTSRVIVAGSTWEDDEIEWTHFVKTHPDIKFIFAPHEVDAERIEEVSREFPGSVRYGEMIKDSSNVDITASNCLIIDNIGMLSRLYHYATLTYVGGGFGYDGLHNILEAAVYGKPVIFGPEYEKHYEAVELIEAGGAVSIENALELEKVVGELLLHSEEITLMGQASRNYIYRNAGASQKIVEYIQANRLLTS